MQPQESQESILEEDEDEDEAEKQSAAPSKYSRSSSLQPRMMSSLGSDTALDTHARGKLAKKASLDDLATLEKHHRSKHGKKASLSDLDTQSTTSQTLSMTLSQKLSHLSYLDVTRLKKLRPNKKVSGVFRGLVIGAHHLGNTVLVILYW